MNKKKKYNCHDSKNLSFSIDDFQKSYKLVKRKYFQSKNRKLKTDIEKMLVVSHADLIKALRSFSVEDFNCSKQKICIKLDEESINQSYKEMIC